MHGELSWNKVDGSKLSEKLWCYDRQNRNHDYWLSQTIRNDNYIGSSSNPQALGYTIQIDRWNHKNLPWQVESWYIYL